MRTPLSPSRPLALLLLLACNKDAPGDKDPTQPTDSLPEVEQIPSADAPWQRQEVAAPGSITFSELLYHPADDEDLEWLELHNPMAIAMDLSGWSIQGGAQFSFPEGSILPAGADLVVAADPARLALETGYAEALGPYEGNLSDDGERLELFNNFGRLIDTVNYGEHEPWPVQPDGSGLSLAKMDPDAASDRAESWTYSAQLGGTPGASNQLDPTEPWTTVELVALDATWRYEASGDSPDAGWADPDYDDSAWDVGQAIFYAGDAEAAVLVTAWVTADNYYGLYLGQADGTDLRLVGLDPDGDWTSVDPFDIEVGPLDHLYIAAWEAPWDYGGPQMTIGEVEMPDGVVGTDASTFEWVLGPTAGCPGTTPGDPPPDEAELAALVAAAESAGSWALPAVEADRASDPWGWANSASFEQGTQYIWVDTFDSTSVTNIDNTYALFRSIDPLQGPAGSTELSPIPTTATFRTEFTLDGNPDATELSLSCVLDDGAVVYLNGVEVLRENLPEGTISSSTLALSAVTDSGELGAEISSSALLRGTNVLAVELHQAQTKDEDLRFGCALTARIAPDRSTPTVVLNELAPSGEDPFWVELLNLSSQLQDGEGLVLASSAGDERVLSAGQLKPGTLYVEELGFGLEEDDVLFLYAADRSALLDAVRVKGSARGRAEEGGAWLYVNEASPGEANSFSLTEDVVINEIQYHHAPLSQEGQPITDDPEEWIELYNRGVETVDLSGWRLVDAVAFEFPEGSSIAPGAFLVVAADAETLASQHPEIEVLGSYSGRLDNKSDRVLLLDANKNPADELRYYDGGRWPGAADGGGSTLELRDPRADNSSPEAWAASDERDHAQWVSVSYRGEDVSSAVGPDGTWEEFVLGMLDEGELLIDDISVIRDPDGTPVEMIENGGFDDDSEGWRLLGNHRRSAVVPDPDDPSNPVLHLVATGSTGHMHNHVETTLLKPIKPKEYLISYRARWISGSNQLNTRLYFNRLPNTVLVEQPTSAGTPGAPNSALQDNLGPTYGGLSQDLAVPAAYETVRVSVTVDDPDGVQEVTLWSSAAGGAFEAQAMRETDAGVWEADLQGQAAGTLVQIYVQAEDSLGAQSMFPPAGPDSRALLKFDDGLAEDNGLHNMRLLITEADSDWLHEDINLMSDEGVGATVIYNESKVFYDVELRTKGSERGRPQSARLGYSVAFHSEQPFRGSHSSVHLDRSQGVNYGQREVLINLVMTHAGSVSGEYNDLIHAMTPLAEHTGAAELQLDRFTGLVLDAQFEDGASGRMFEYELIYYPLTTDDGTPQGYKLPQPDSVVGTSLTDLGEDPEYYRWNFLISNNEREDDYEGLIDLCQTFASSDFVSQADQVIDVDQWLRAYAFAVLSGAVDNYGSDGAAHNARFYIRPDDLRVLYFPHDLDYFGGSTLSVQGNNDLRRLIAEPAYKRIYYGHLNDIIGRAYNGDYMAPWCEQLGELLSGQDIAGACQFIEDRADWVMNDSSDAVMTLFPPVDFRITTNGGADLTVSGAEVTLEGEGWIDVRQIWLDGAALELSWLDEQTWQVTVPLQAGANTLQLSATDLWGAEVGSDSIVVSSGG